MSYTLWSRGRLLGHTDLGWVQVFENLRTGWFHPSPAGEKFMGVLTGTGPALMALSKMMRDPVRELARGVETEPDADYPRDVRRTTEYADLVSIVDELEVLQLELRDPEGKPVNVESMGVDDTHWKISLVSRKERRKIARMYPSDPGEADSPPLPRYTIQVRLRDVPRRRLQVSRLDD
ncbi:MAG: hypothetical protein ABIR92_09310 [Gemmatimonadaceae bacterium]